METTRLTAVVPALAEEISGVLAVLQPLRHALTAGRMDLISKLRIEAEQHLRAAPSMHFVPSWLHIVRRIGGKTLHAREVLRRLGHILDDQDLKNAEKSTLIGSIESDLEQFREILVLTSSSLQAIGEKRRSVPAGKAEIGLIYPSEYFRDVEEFAREMSEINRHLRSLVEVAGDVGAPRVMSLETASFQIFLEVGTATGALLATIVWRLLRTWKQVEEIKKLRAETRKIDAEASDLLEKRSQRLRGDAVERIHKDVMAQCDDTIEPARRNELAISVKQSILYVDSHIQLNVLFEVAASEMPARQTPAAEREIKETKVIRDRGGAMWEIQAAAARPLLGVNAEEKVAPVESEPEN